MVNIVNYNISKLKSPGLHIYDNSEALLKGFSDFLIEKIQEYEGDEKIHICLSGGNTPKGVFKMIGDQYKSRFPWQKIHLYWGDERCVPKSDPESNYGEAYRILLKNISIPEENIHFIDGSNLPEQEVKRYSDELMKHVPLRNGLPCFHVTILGLGNDGHTASIFPDQMFLLKSNDICAKAIHPESGQQRVTITGKVLNNSRLTCFLISGKNKALVLKNMIDANDNAHKYPAFHIQSETGNIHLFVDQFAAELIR